MAKASVQKSSKINFYKFVNVKEPSSSLEEKDPAAYSTTVSLNKSTEAINNLGATINGMAGIVADLKKVEVERLEELNKNQKPKMDPKYGKTKKGSLLGGFAKGILKKGGGFLEGLLGLMGALFKGLIILPALSWLSKEENQAKVVKIIEVIGAIGKFIYDWAAFGITQTIDGLYMLLSDDTSWWEKTIGFGKAIIGIGSLFLGLRWLTNPLKLAKDITRAVKTLVRILTKRGAGPRSRGKGVKGMLLGTALTVGSFVVMDNLTKGPKEEGNNNNNNNNETPGRAKGGVVKGRSKGGWIHGPQSGYPVSLDGGMTTSFIGHGTEFVSMKKGGGSAFVTPYDTPATRKNPGLTALRQAEAKRLGYAEGGEVSLKLTRQDFDALAFITAGEAQRNTNDEYGVAAAVLNRVADPRYPNTVHEVISAPGQYEAYHKGAKNDKALADKFVSEQGQLNIIKALNKLEGRTDFKGTSMYQHMGASDIKFSDRGNFYHYPEQRKKSDPKPDIIPTHYKKLISGDAVNVGSLQSTGPGGYIPGNRDSSGNETETGGDQQGRSPAFMRMFNKLFGMVKGLGLFDGGGEYDPKTGEPVDSRMKKRVSKTLPIFASGGELAKLGDNTPLANAPRGQCTTGVILTAEKVGANIGHPSVYTSRDPNNPRGLMSQAINRFGWGSIKGLGNPFKIRSPYGNANVRVMDKDLWAQSVKDKKIPSGALIFTTSHANWNAARGSSGNDSAIAKNGGMKLWSGHWQNGRYKGVASVYGSGTTGVVALTHPKNNELGYDGTIDTSSADTTSSSGGGSGESQSAPTKIINAMGLGSPSSSLSMQERMGYEVSSQFSSAKDEANALTKATEERNASRQQFKDNVSTAVLQAQSSVNASNVATSNAVNQAQEGLSAAASSGGGGSTPSVNSLPGVGTVNINGVLKSTAYALNSNNNFMRGILR